jgi:putative NADPH-quinone reductase
MLSKIIIIQGHPDSSRRHLCHTLADAYADAAVQAGHEVGRVEIAGIEFPMLRTQEEFNSGTPPASLKPAVDAIVAADHIVLVFPLWLGTLPALAKAFLEQVIRPGVAFSYEKYGAKNCWPNRRSAQALPPLQRLHGPGDHILRNLAERIVESGDGCRRLDLVEF